MPVTENSCATVRALDVLTTRKKIAAKSQPLRVLLDSHPNLNHVHAVVHTLERKTFKKR